MSTTVSADESLAIARRLAAADARVRVFAQKNGGICAARNCALAAARGEYVGFCDDDDLYLPGALHAVAAQIRQTGADVVRAGYELWRENAAGQPVQLPHPVGEPCALGPCAGRRGLSGVSCAQRAAVCVERMVPPRVPWGFAL